jgi:hypothetical protein
MTQRRTCAACDNPASDGVTICGRCERITSRHLGDMEAHRAELEVTLARQTRLTAASDGGRSANTPLPYQEQASALLGSQRATLVSWTRLVHDEIDGVWPVDTIGAMALFIERHMAELRKHEAAGELVSEIGQLVNRIMRCVDYPDDRARIHVGPCPEEDEDGEKCPGELHLHLPYANDGKRPRVRCSVCQTVWFPEQFIRLGHRVKFQREGVERLRRALFGAA